MRGSPVTKSPWRVFAVVFMIAAGACFVAGVEYYSVNDQQTTGRDFIQYWAIGRQLDHGANPYDVPAIVALEQSVGLGAAQPRISLSPPTVLWPMLPLGLLSPRIGFIVWSFVELGCLSIAMWLLWRLNGCPESRIHLFTYAYAPALVCLMSGQLGIFLLLAVVSFLYLHPTRPALAGAALLPCALKPHLFLVLVAVLLLWIVHRGTFRVLFGFLAALAASCAITLAIDVHVWSQYFDMMHSTRVLQVFIPTFGVVLRCLVDNKAPSLQFIPAAVGAVWAGWWFWTRRNRWDWMDQGLWLLLVSDVCAPYGYFTDECILLPFILAAFYRATASGRSFLPLALINAAALIEVLAGVNIISPYFLWTTPAWLGWYLYAVRSKD
ncbi:MAG TPA: glycosyltransferase family 87 protein [Terracidiphilus sp.]|jgi:hypothetical protein|nr:glycosyltransferase family 87 protein [Terracidiphilus sp.]